ncbi:MAG TPA: hypothetical protein VMX38_14355 [Verrucomicrobiae bacterium]|jgi:uncharacterized Tic20 family protein|nr:hypothetical protein [Verrucomicrobiae bacterium]
MVHLIHFLKHVAELLAILAGAGLVIFLVLSVFMGPSAAWNLYKRAWQAWKDLAHKIGNFQARVILSIFYGILVLPFGLAARWFSDPLRIKKRPEQWLDHPNEAYDLEWARKQ